MNNTLTDRCVNKPNLTHAPHRASSFRLYSPPPPPLGRRVAPLSFRT